MLQSSGNGQSCGCGSGGNAIGGNAFSFGAYTFKNSGAYEVTIEARVTDNGQSLDFKCDAKIMVGT